VYSLTSLTLPSSSSSLAASPLRPLVPGSIALDSTRPRLPRLRPVSAVHIRINQASSADATSVRRLEKPASRPRAQRALPLARLGIGLGPALFSRSLTLLILLVSPFVRLSSILCSPFRSNLSPSLSILDTIFRPSPRCPYPQLVSRSHIQAPIE
jgi:hypothetical protein